MSTIVLRKRVGGWGMAAAGAVWVILSLVSIVTLTIFQNPEESPVADVISWGFLPLCVVIVVGLAHFLHGDAYREQQSQGKPGAPRGDTIKRVVLGLFLYLGIWVGVYLFLQSLLPSDKP